jgi:hypothetical protein
MSTLQASDLDTASRSDLIARAEALGIDKADVLTRAELIDEIVKRTVADPLERRLARGLLGVARDLVARVVERGLHLPDAAALIRGLQQATLKPVTPPIATVTLAGIYAGQGHRNRALAVLDEVLAKEPEHTAARALRDKVGSLPDDAVAPFAPSDAPPKPGPSLGADGEPAQQGEPEPVMASGDASDHAQDTLPPASDALPTLVPERPAWRADAANVPLPAAAAIEDAAEPPLAAARTMPSDLSPHATEGADRVILLPVDVTSALASWELRAAALGEARARTQGGELILRVVAVTPSWDGPSAEVRDIEIEMPSGDWLLSDLPPGAVVRAAVGWRSEGGFNPLAVALDVASDGGREQRSAQGCASSWPTLAFAPWEAPYASASTNVDAH